MPKKDKVSTEHIVCLNDTISESEFLQMNEWDAIKKYGHIIYGYVAEDEIGKYLNPKRRKDRDETVNMKIGMLHKEDAKNYEGMTVEEALIERCKNDHSGSDERIFYIVMCFPSSKTDFDFRKFLVNKVTKYGYSKGDGENVRGLSALNLTESYHLYMEGTKATNNFLPSKSQETAIQKMVSWFTTHAGKFLLAAKMRFGKNFVILNVFERLGWKTVLFSTYSPSVFSSMEDEVNEHVGLSKLFDVVDLRDIDAIDRIIECKRNGKYAVILASMQLLNYKDGDHSECDDDNEGRKNLKLLKSFPIDCFILDESHNGGHSKYPKNAIQYLGIKNEIHMTGTHSKYANDFEFSTGDNVFTYDIVDERNDDSDRAKSMPLINFLSMSLPKSLVSKIQSDYLPFEKFSFRRFLDVDAKGNFKHPGQVKDFFKVIFGGYDSGNIKENEVFKNLSIYNISEIEEPINHCLVVLPKNTRIVKAVWKMLRKERPGLARM